MPVKPNRLALTCFFVGLTLFSSAQIKIGSGIHLPQDSVVRFHLINSLNGFLAEKDKPNKENEFVPKEYLPETSDLLDEMKNAEQNPKLKDPDFYKCYLINVTKTSENDFIIKIAYMGLQDNMPVLRASYKLLAKHNGDRFYFYSPLKQNTATWRTKKFGNLTCYFKDSLKVADVKAYGDKVAFYNKKLKLPDGPIEFYYCGNFNEVQQVLGIDYKLEYNGAIANDLTSHENGSTLIVNGQISYPLRFDPHDLWHERLRMAMDSHIINRPMDEGCAYLYGGSWGYTWEEVKERFRKYLVANPHPDWLKLYIETTNFEDGDKPMKVGYMLNALIAQKLEREKGFAAVMELLGCGPREKGDDNYFKTLDKLTGINKGNFNAEMDKLVKDF